MDSSPGGQSPGPRCLRTAMPPDGDAPRATRGRAPGRTPAASTDRAPQASRSGGVPSGVTVRRGRGRSWSVGRRPGRHRGTPRTQWSAGVPSGVAPSGAPTRYGSRGPTPRISWLEGAQRAFPPGGAPRAAVVATWRCSVRCLRGALGARGLPGAEGAATRRCRDSASPRGFYDASDPKGCHDASGAKARTPPVAHGAPAGRAGPGRFCRTACPRSPRGSPPCGSGLCGLQAARSMPLPRHPQAREAVPSGLAASPRCGETRQRSGTASGTARGSGWGDTDRNSPERPGTAGNGPEQLR